MYSAIADQLECLQLLLNCGATVGLQDTTGQTALHWAAATVRLALEIVYFTCSCVFSVVVLFFGVFQFLSFICVYMCDCAQECQAQREPFYKVF